MDETKIEFEYELWESNAEWTEFAFYLGNTLAVMGLLIGLYLVIKSGLSGGLEGIVKALWKWVCALITWIVVLSLMS